VTNNKENSMATYVLLSTVTDEGAPIDEFIASLKK
jgi:uncharacterized protein with GYD domain